MGRYLGPILFLGVFVAWLVLSYVSAPLPTVSYGGLSSAFAPLLAAGAILFLTIQLWLVVASAKLFRADGALRRSDVRAEFRLRRRSEVLWTAVPLGMTLLLSWWSYPTWAGLLGW